MPTVRSISPDEPRSMRTRRHGSMHSIIHILRNIMPSNRSRNWRESRSGWISLRRRTCSTYLRASSSTRTSCANTTNIRNAIWMWVQVANCLWYGAIRFCGTANYRSVGISSRVWRWPSPQPLMPKSKSPIGWWIRISIPTTIQPGKTP